MKKSFVLYLMGCSLLGLILTIFVYYTSQGKPPTEIAGAIITCTQTVCTSQATSPSCTQLNVAVTRCLTSANVYGCLAGVPALIGVGYADVVCIVATLAENPSKAIATRTISKPMTKSFNKSGRDLDYDSIPDENDLDTSAIQNNASKWLKAQRVSVHK